jgi:S-DNA-T family DNA segregation ATPase FtsK/SpoIIIE
VTASALRREFAGIGLLLAGAFLLGALLLQVPEVGARCVEARGPFGPLGSWLRCVLVGAVGLPGGLLLSIGLVGTALVLFGRVTAALDSRRAALFWAGVVVLVPVAIGLALGAPPEAGDATGLVGGMAAHYLHKALGAAGAWLAWLLVFCTVTVVTLRWNPLRLVLGRATPTASAEAPRTPGGAPLLARVLEPEPGELPAIDPRLARDALAAAERSAGSPAASSGTSADPGAPGTAASAAKGRRVRERDAAPPLPAAVELEDLPAHVGDSLPPTDLLTPPPPRNAEAGRRELDAAGERLLATLRTFKVASWWGVPPAPP